MKNFYKTCVLASITFFTTSHSMLQICFGTGTAGLAYALYQETGKDNNVGAVKELFQMGKANTGLGSSIEKLRFNIQKNIYDIVSKRNEQQGSFENLKLSLTIEKIAYGTAMALGAIMALYGLKDFFQQQ